MAMQGDTVADRVLGQLDFVHNAPNRTDATGMWSPRAIAIDSSVTPNRLYVSDGGNSRILGYKDVATFVNGGAADLVIGQPDLNSGTSEPEFGVQPQREQSVLSGRRYRGFRRQPICGGYRQQPRARIQRPVRRLRFFPLRWLVRHLVFGQGDNFNANGCDSSGLSASSLCFPVGVAVDTSDDLYVVDESDSRVLEFTNPLTATRPLTTYSGRTALHLDRLQCRHLKHVSRQRHRPLRSQPRSQSTDGDLYVAEFSNNRVLEYNAPLTNTTANHVFGQNGSFTTATLTMAERARTALTRPLRLRWTAAETSISRTPTTGCSSTAAR